MTSRSNDTGSTAKVDVRGMRLRRHADFQTVYRLARKQYGKQISFFFARRKPSGVVEVLSGGAVPFVKAVSGHGNTADGSMASLAMSDAGAGMPAALPAVAQSQAAWPGQSCSGQGVVGDHDAAVEPGRKTTSTTANMGQRSAAVHSGPRVGLTVGKVLGKAHDRNRIKRRLREAVRRQAGILGLLPVDVVLHPKRSYLVLPWAELEAEVAQAFQTVKRLADKPQVPGPQRERKAGKGKPERSAKSPSAQDARQPSRQGRG